MGRGELWQALDVVPVILFAPAIGRIHVSICLIVMHTVGSAAEAKQAVNCGVDIVVAQSWESGGQCDEFIELRGIELHREQLQ